MQGDELQLRNAAIVAALERGVNLYEVAETVELSPKTIRIIAMGAGMTLTPAQRTKLANRQTAPSRSRSGKGTEARTATRSTTRKPFAEHLAEMDARNARIGAALQDPSVTVPEILVEFSIAESTVLTIGWDQGVWEGRRRPQGEGRIRRDAAIVELLIGGGTAEQALRKFGISTAHARTLARNAGLKLPKASARRGRTTARNNAIAAALLAQTATLEELGDTYHLQLATVELIARQLGVPAELRGVRGASTSKAPSARDLKILARAVDDGALFSDIARDFGIGRERVRQIVEALTGKNAHDLAEVRAERVEAAKIAEAYRFAERDPEMTCTDIATATRLPVGQVRQLLGPLEVARRIRERDPLGFNVRLAIAELRRVWLAAGRPATLSGVKYNENRHPSVVGAESISKRIGSWARACELAGVPAKAGHGKYSLRWSREDCLDWVGLFLQQTADVTDSALVAWLTRTPGSPSMGTIVNRCQTWGIAVRAAVERIDSAQWQDPTTPRPDRDATAPGAAAQASKSTEDNGAWPDRS